MGRALAADMSPAARFLVDQHLLAGDFCILLSASPHELVDAVSVALGAHRAIGTRIEVVDGVLTGRLDGPLCYGAAKLDALEREVGLIDLTTATAYADSASDLPAAGQLRHRRRRQPRQGAPPMGQARGLAHRPARLTADPGR